MLIWIFLLVLCLLILHESKEFFAIADTGSIITDISSLDPNISYLVIKRKKSNTISDAVNGGSDCVEFPDVIFQVAPVASYSQTAILSKTVPIR